MIYENSGDECEDYKWNQTDNELTCEVRIVHIYKKCMELRNNNFNLEKTSLDDIKRLLRVEMKTNNIKIFIDKECIFSKDLYLEINVEYSTWYIDESVELSKEKKEVKSFNLALAMEKKKPSIWSKCFKSDKPIDLSKITSKKRFNEFDEKSKMDIMRTIYERGNNNNTDNIHNILKEAWNKENSPFKGVKYDPELVKKMLS
ncbi:hypothetical protein FG379_002783 [Cryptosporidium bovis]|uniref:uncharacterized protein n=1 Tax=Cryptosporidium bovis TaxID=310047 RepID=UPI00351A27E4|nr:hypothetical protein FG379_002783 [Cryptosporidium bovis]